ncbi:MAG: VWA domain-containing protein [Treponema sp.]|uniref:vWA domain-containing protein n=1 Tax=Treponema sp. TaxID=166 RepID=UPI001B5EB383|nr:vWA domain-containing protein [Treponema sp.]MBP5402231.1 VWA domain-containing protein [Treponema sp.]MBR5933004.1 VWA domain-containing protein [Treponema sp.]
MSNTAVFAQKTDKNTSKTAPDAQKTETKLIIYPQDVKIIEEKDSKTGKTAAFHLYIRKKTGIQSVMLTETTKDPAGQEPNYAYRAKEYNKINGDEIRMLNGEILDSPGAKYSLVDSTVEDTEFFGKAFHIYIPQQIIYGYSWSRNGTVNIGKGTFINIRTFEKKYCDYTGKFFDNPFMFDFEVKKKVKREKLEEPVKEEVQNEVVLTDDYNPIAAHTFEQISDFMIYSKGPETIVDDIMNSIKKIPPEKTADVVFAIDATGSMKDDIQKLKEEWVPALVEGLKDYKDIRLGLLFYRDYTDSYNYNGLPVRWFGFTTDSELFIRNLKGIKINGLEGGDIPEAVYEALYASMTFYDWRNDAEKKVILIGDAEPHPTPRKTGKYSRELVEKISKEKDIKINAIITPDDKGRRGR